MAAKRYGVYCKEFAVGMGPKVYSYQSKKSETAYSFRALPLGGFVAMAGEPGEQGMEDVPLERTIKGISAPKRLVVMLAGVFMNLILAILVFFFIFQINGIILEPEPVIQEVVAGYPADLAGMQANDRLLSIEIADGSKIELDSFYDISIALMTFEGRDMIVTVDRDGEILKLELTPEYSEESENFVLGVRGVSGELKKTGIGETLGYTVKYIFKVVGQIVMTLKLLVRGIGLNNVGGPVAIFQETSKVSSAGFDALYFWNLVGSLSISLSVMNLIPIPVLDGGRALLTFIEIIIGRPIPEKLENTLMGLGLVIMLALFLFFIVNDIKKL